MELQGMAPEVAKKFKYWQTRTIIASMIGYAVGQLMNTYLSLSKSANKNLSFINPLLQTTSNEMIKRTVLQMFKKYSYAITDTDYRIKNLYGHVIQYDMTGKEVNHYFLSAGFVDGNLVYTKREKEEQ